MSNIKQNYHSKLKDLMDQLVHSVYDLTINFPKEEQYGLTSQIRRSSLSIILNYIEGYARFSKPTLAHFLEISYGSLKETKYLLYFSLKRGYIKKTEYDKVIVLTDEIGKMLWGTLENLRK